MSHSEPLSPKSLAPGGHLPEDEDEEMADAEEDQEDQEEEGAANQEEQNAQPNSSPAEDTRPPRETRKDRDLNDFLNDMDKYAPIVRLLLLPGVLIPRSRMPWQSTISPSPASSAPINACTSQPNPFPSPPPNLADSSE